jgi:hypothetical protein
MGKKIVSPILHGQVMYFFTNCNRLSIVHNFKMIIFHVTWTFERQITIYNVIGELIIAYINYNTYYILTIVQTYDKIMMNTKIQDQI